jgi:hypothetical protein
MGKNYVCARKYVSQGGLPTKRDKERWRLKSTLKFDQSQERHILK